MSLLERNRTQRSEERQGEQAEEKLEPSRGGCLGESGRLGRVLWRGRAIAGRLTYGECGLHEDGKGLRTERLSGLTAQPSLQQQQRKKTEQEPVTGGSAETGHCDGGLTPAGNCGGPRPERRGES